MAFKSSNTPLRWLDAASQLILVQTKEWSSIEGTCFLLERNQHNWRVQQTFPIVVGKNGLRWGQGLHQMSTDYIKQEGDGAGPAGIFLLGTAFGDLPINNSQWPFRKTTDSDLFIDDSRSNFYNQWVDTATTQPDWNSHEVMNRPDGLYKRGLVIQHNMNPVQPNFGSAIFFHIWRSDTQPTLGCTAATYHHTEALLNWLRVEKQPLLLQFPISFFNFNLI